ncbi:MAG: DNA-directed RNA polymerase subunit beta' [Erythrobacter sp.]|uniref:DNA-directed RNA polymerase subunit beta' n=1 Tax=Erythrobacter sp. TaxID=1042 RepID=UPI0032EC4772
MTQHRSPTDRTRSLITQLAQPMRIDALGPVAGRFIYSLRLIAAHERVQRDPVPELAIRLGGMETAAKALAMSQAIAWCWPENVHVSRFCCCHLTYDEATIGAMIESAAGHDRDGFFESVTGLVRPERIERLWDDALALVSAEMRAG